MVALVNSDYAVTSDGSKIYLYYQYNDDNNLYQIREIASSNGSSWTENKVVVAENPSPGGSPITAYYVAHDGTADMKSTVKEPLWWVTAVIKDNWVNLCFV